MQGNAYKKKLEYYIEDRLFPLTLIAFLGTLLWFAHEYVTGDENAIAQLIALIAALVTLIQRILSIRDKINEDTENKPPSTFASRITLVTKESSVTPELRYRLAAEAVQRALSDHSMTVFHGNKNELVITGSPESLAEIKRRVDNGGLTLEEPIFGPIYLEKVIGSKQDKVYLPKSTMPIGRQKLNYYDVVCYGRLEKDNKPTWTKQLAIAEKFIGHKTTRDMEKAKVFVAYTPYGIYATTNFIKRGRDKTAKMIVSSFLDLRTVLINLLIEDRYFSLILDSNLLSRLRNNKKEELLCSLNHCCVYYAILSEEGDDSPVDVHCGNSFNCENVSKKINAIEMVSEFVRGN